MRNKIIWLWVLIAILNFDKMPSCVFWPYGAMAGILLALIAGFKLAGRK